MKRKPVIMPQAERRVVNAAMRWWGANPYSGITSLNDALRRACAALKAKRKSGK